MEESDRDVQEPFTPTDTSDTSDESEVSEYSPTEKRKKHMKKKRPKRKRTVVKLRRAPSLPEMSDIEYDSDSGSPELGDYIEARKPISTPKQEVSGINQLALQNSRTEVSAKTPNVVQIHLNAGAAAGGTTINLDLSDLVLGKRSFDEIGLTCLPTPDGSDAPATPISVVIDETSQVGSGTLYPPSKRIRMLGNAKARFPSTRQSKKGFCDIPFELRVR